MKILYLDFNFKHIYRTRNLLPLIFGKYNETHFYGPGYSDKATLAMGLEEYIRKHGPFDVLVATEHITMFPFWDTSTSNLWKTRYSFSFDPELIYLSTSYLEAFKNFRGIKIAALMETDYYNLSAEACNSLEEMNAYVVGWGADFVKPLNELTQLELDSFTQHANNNWYHYITKNSNKIISLPYFVAQHEFSHQNLSSRLFDWSVVGADYHSRQSARKSLSDRNIYWAGNGLRRFFSLVNKIKFNVYNKSLTLEMLFFVFKVMIQYSRYSYTDGSRLRYPVRKFFEIPALGTVLVCDECNGFENLGFIDGINCLVATPETILDVYKFLQENPEKAQMIANSGKKLVYENHSLDARAVQLQLALNSILSQKFKGCYWKEAKFLLVE